MNKSLRALEELDKYEKKFEIECEVIDALKCYLLKNKSVDGFVYNGNSIDKDGDKYLLYYDDYCFIIDICGDIVMDFDCMLE